MEEPSYWLAKRFEVVYKGFRLLVRDLAEGVKDPMKFFCPGSTLRMLVNNERSIGWGMPKEAVARFADRNLLSSDWLMGEEILAKKPTVLEVRLGKGRVLVYATRPQFRGKQEQHSNSCSMLFTATPLQTSNLIYSYF